MWLWGPTVWSVLHAAAHLADAGVWDTKVQDLSTLLRNLQPVLPCRYCRDSYGPFLAEALAERGEPLELIIESRKVSGLVFDLHNKVNSKLARQRWDELRGLLRAQMTSRGAGVRALECLECEETAEHAIQILDKRPTQLSVLKRQAAFDREPCSVHAVLLVLVCLARRAEQDAPQGPALRSVIAAVSSIFTRVRSVPYDNLSAGLKIALGVPPPRLRVALEELYAQFYGASPAELEARVQLFTASACGAGTCK